MYILQDICYPCPCELVPAPVKEKEAPCLCRIPEPFIIEIKAEQLRRIAADGDIPVFVPFSMHEDLSRGSETDVRYTDADQFADPHTRI